MTEPVIDFSGIPLAKQEPETAEGTAPFVVDLLGIPFANEDPDKPFRDYVQSVMEPSRPSSGAPEWRQGEAPSFIKRLWRQLTEPDFAEKRAESALSLTIGREKGISPSKTEPPGFFETGRQGYKQSVLGLAERAMYEDKRYEAISKEAFDRMSPVQRALFSSAMLGGNLPFIVAGAALGAMAGGPLAPFTAVGGAFALPAGLRKVYADRIEKGEITTFKEFWDRLIGAVVETLKGEVTGILTKGAGVASGPFAFPAEVYTMTFVGAALEGHLPEPEDFIDAALVIGGMKLTGVGAGKTKSVVTDIYRKTGKTPTEVLKDIKTDPTIKQDILDIGNRRVEKAEIKDLNLTEVKEKMKTVEDTDVPPTPTVSPETKPDLPKSYEHLREKPPISEGGETPPTRQRKFIKTVEEAKTTDPNLVGKVKEIDPQEYVVQPNAKSLAKAEERLAKDGLGETVDYVLSKADLNAEKGATFITLMKEFEKEGNTEQFLRMLEAYDHQLRTAGEFIQAASIWTKNSPAGFIRWAEKQLEATRDQYSLLDTLFKNKPETFSFTPKEKASIMERIIEIQGMKEGPNKTDAMFRMIDKVARKVPPSVSEMIDAYRYGNMLIGPRTQQRNIGENLVQTLFFRTSDVALRGSIDWVKASLFGLPRKAWVSDAPLYLKTAVNAVPNGLEAFMDVWKLRRGAEIGKPDVGLKVGSEFQRARMAQMPKSLTVVSRFMEASDKFFSAMIRSGEFALQKKGGATDAQAYAAGQKIAEKYLYRNKLDPSDPDLSLFSKILVSTGKLMNEARDSKKYTPAFTVPMKWFVAFIRTPINKGAQMIESSPLGVFRTKWNTEAAAKILGGSMVAAVGAMMAYNGQTTWVAPSDPELKKWFYASGRRQFSMRLGDKWVPMWYLGRFGVAFGIPAAIKYYTQDEKTVMVTGATKKIQNISQGLARFIGSQTSTQNIASLFGSIAGDIDFSFAESTAFTAGQAIPASSFIRYVNSMIDPVYRSPKGFWESFVKDIPIMSKKLDFKTDPFWRQAKRDSLNYFVPYDLGTVDSGSGEIFEMLRLEKQYKFMRSKIDRTIDEAGEGAKKGINIDKMFDGLEKIYNQLEIKLPPGGIEPSEKKAERLKGTRNKFNPEDLLAVKMFDGLKEIYNQLRKKFSPEDLAEEEIEDMGDIN